MYAKITPKYEFNKPKLARSLMKPTTKKVEGNKYANIRIRVRRCANFDLDLASICPAGTLMSTTIIVVTPDTIKLLPIHVRNMGLKYGSRKLSSVNFCGMTMAGLKMSISYLNALLKDQ
jgi:hypothetical protein